MWLLYYQTIQNSSSINTFGDIVVRGLGTNHGRDAEPLNPCCNGFCLFCDQFRTIKRGESISSHYRDDHVTSRRSFICHYVRSDSEGTNVVSVCGGRLFVATDECEIELRSDVPEYGFEDFVLLRSS